MGEGRPDLPASEDGQNFELAAGQINRIDETTQLFQEDSLNAALRAFELADFDPKTVKPPKKAEGDRHGSEPGPPVLKIDQELELAPGLLPEADQATRSIYEEVSPSVVRIETEASIGSGFFADDDGRVVTDAHVVQDRREVKVKTKDGHFYRARIEKLDDINDLAVLKLVDYEPGTVKPLELGDIKTVRADMSAWALGHPRGARQIYISPGFVRRPSSPRDLNNQLNPNINTTVNKIIHNMSPDEAAEYRAIQSRPLIHTRLHIEPGNSGGPLVNEEGKVVGVADMVININPSLSYHTPSIKVQELLEQRQEDHKFKFTYRYGPADWVANYRAGWSETPAKNGLHTLAAGYLGYKYARHMPASGSLLAKATTLGIGYWGASSLVDDYGQFKSATSTADRWKFGIDVGADALMTGGSLVTMASYLGRVSTAVPKLRAAATIGMGLGVVAKLGSDWIPNRLILTDIERTDGTYRPPIRADFMSHLR